MPVMPSPFFAEPACRSFNPVKSTWCSGLSLKLTHVCAEGKRKLGGSMCMWGYKRLWEGKDSLKTPCQSLLMCSDEAWKCTRYQGSYTLEAVLFVWFCGSVFTQ